MLPVASPTPKDSLVWKFVVCVKAKGMPGVRMTRSEDPVSRFTVRSTIPMISVSIAGASATLYILTPPRVMSVEYCDMV